MLNNAFGTLMQRKTTRNTPNALKEDSGANPPKMYPMATNNETLGIQ
jgi:hypothetical protein